MKIFVTVGTTPFDRLINFFDQNAFENDEIIIQTGNSKIVVKNHKSFKWTKDIFQYFEWADLIVCHAGAGTIYNLIEKGKPIIVVPNLDRIDPHQSEIANYIERNNYGLVCNDVTKIPAYLVRAKQMTFAAYKKDEFFLKDSIIDLIKKQISKS